MLHLRAEAVELESNLRRPAWRCLEAAAGWDGLKAALVGVVLPSHMPGVKQELDDCNAGVEGQAAVARQGGRPLRRSMAGPDLVAQLRKRLNRHNKGAQRLHSRLASLGV